MHLVSRCEGFGLLRSELASCLSLQFFSYVHGLPAQLSCMLFRVLTERKLGLSQFAQPQHIGRGVYEGPSSMLLFPLRSLRRLRLLKPCNATTLLLLNMSEVRV